MGDKIVLIRDGDTYHISFLIDGRYWPVIDEEQGGKVRAFPSPEKACMWLREVRDRYERKYGDQLDWNLDDLPVVCIGRGNG